MAQRSADFIARVILKNGPQRTAYLQANANELYCLLNDEEDTDTLSKALALYPSSVLLTLLQQKRGQLTLLQRLTKPIRLTNIDCLFKKLDIDEWWLLLKQNSAFFEDLVLIPAVNPCFFINALIPNVYLHKLHNKINDLNHDYLKALLFSLKKEILLEVICNLGGKNPTRPLNKLLNAPYMHVLIETHCLMKSLQNPHLSVEAFKQALNRFQKECLKPEFIEPLKYKYAIADFLHRIHPLVTAIVGTAIGLFTSGLLVLFLANPLTAGLTSTLLFIAGGTLIGGGGGILLHEGLKAIFKPYTDHNGFSCLFGPKKMIQSVEAVCQELSELSEDYFTPTPTS